MLRFFRRPLNEEMAPLRSEHAGECARIHAHGFRHAWSRVELESMLSDASMLADGAFESDERLLAFVLSRCAADEAEIVTIAVDRDMRRRGLGARLLTHHFATLTMRRVKKLFLEVEEGNQAARALYASLDFKQVGVREAYYRADDNTRANALVLARDL